MKVLLSVLIILNLIVIRFFIIKGNVRFSFGADKKRYKQRQSLDSQLNMRR